MKLIDPGYWPCRVIDAQYGENPQGIPTVRINVALIGKEHDGVRQTYEEEVTNRAAPYIARTCKAVGWRGHILASLEDDVAEWVAETGGKSEIEIKHITIKRGPRAGSIWAKPNGIGGRPVLRPVSAQRAADADAVMRDFASGGAPPDDDFPPPGEEELPFVSQSWAVDCPRGGGAW